MANPLRIDWRLSVSALLAVVLGMWGWTAPSPWAAFAAGAEAAEQPAEEAPPPPVELKGSELLTKDGVQLQATYFQIGRASCRERV